MNCVVCDNSLSIETFAPTVEAREIGLCCDCREATIDIEIARRGLSTPPERAAAYEFRQVIGDSLRLGRAPRWRNATSASLPGINTPEARVALHRYFWYESARRFGPSSFPDDVDEMHREWEWDEPPKFRAFGLPAHIYGVCLIFPRPIGAADPVAHLQCRQCRTRTEEMTVPEFVPLPSHFSDWLLVFPRRGRVQACCAQCLPIAQVMWKLEAYISDNL